VFRSATPKEGNVPESDKDVEKLGNAPWNQGMVTGMMAGLGGSAQFVTGESLGLVQPFINVSYS